MRPTNKMLAQSLLLVWPIICLTQFLYANRVSYVSYLQIIVVTDGQILAETLDRIFPLRFTLDLLGAWLGVMLFSLACISLGLGVLRGMNSQANLALGVTAFLVGEILFSLVFLAVISLYRLTPAFIAIALLLGFLAGLPAFGAFISRLPRSNLPADFEPSERIVLWLIISVVVLGLLYSSARLGYDAVVEYFSHAKIMAISQLPIFFYPKDPFVVSSFHPSILFTALIQLFGDQSARMLSWANGLAILLMGLAFAQELRLTPRAKLWFSTLMVTSTAFVDLLGDGKVELISTAPILAAVFWALRSLEQPNKGAFALIGLLAGFAIVSRPYNIFLVSVFMVLFYTGQIYARQKAGSFDFKQFMRPALWMLPPVVILGAFNLFENWLLLKSLLAPLTYARGLDTAIWQWQFDPAKLTLFRLLYPFTVTFHNSPQSLGNISPLFVAFLPFLLAKKIRGNLRLVSTLRWLFLTAMLTLALWIMLFFTVVEIRYVLFLWVILCLPMAQALESVIQHAEILIRPLLRALLTILLAAIGARTLLISLLAYAPLDNDGQAHCYDMVFCSFLEPLNQSASPGDRVLVLHAYRYYLRPDLFACSSRSDEYPVLEELARRNSPDFWMEVYRQGYRFITYERNYAERHSHFGTIPDPSLAPAWLQVKILSAMPEGKEVIYILETSDAPYQSKTSCIQNSMGIWEIHRGH